MKPQPAHLKKIPSTKSIDTSPLPKRTMSPRLRRPSVRPLPPPSKALATSSSTNTSQMKVVTLNKTIEDLTQQLNASKLEVEALTTKLQASEASVTTLTQQKLELQNSLSSSNTDSSNNNNDVDDTVQKLSKELEEERLARDGMQTLVCSF